MEKGRPSNAEELLKRGEEAAVFTKGVRGKYASDA